MSMTASTSTIATGRDNNFNLIRMAAASLVLVSHAFPISLGPTAAEPFLHILKGTSLGKISVMVFFALSGFLITKSFTARRSALDFILPRMSRLYPALIVNALLTVAVAGLVLTSDSPQVFWRAAPGYIRGVLGLYNPAVSLPGVFDGVPYASVINGSLWTLFYEVACYAGVFALGTAGLLRKGPFFILALIGLSALFVISPEINLPGRVHRMIQLSFPFALGSALYLYRDQIPFSPRTAALLTLITGGAYTTMFFPLMLNLLISYAVLLAGFRTNRLLLKYNLLGDYSYGVYIYAFPIQQIVAQTGITQPLANIACALPLTLVCAALSWHFVESPALAATRRWRVCPAQPEAPDTADLPQKRSA